MNHPSNSIWTQIHSHVWWGFSWASVSLISLSLVLICSQLFSVAVVAVVVVAPGPMRCDHVSAFRDWKQRTSLASIQRLRCKWRRPLRPRCHPQWVPNLMWHSHELKLWVLLLTTRQSNVAMTRGTVWHLAAIKFRLFFGAPAVRNLSLGMEHGFDSSMVNMHDHACVFRYVHVKTHSDRGRIGMTHSATSVHIFYHGSTQFFCFFFPQVSV